MMKLQKISKMRGGGKLVAFLACVGAALLQHSLYGGVFDDASVYLRGPVDADGDHVLDPGEYRDSFHYGTSDAAWSAVALGSCRLATERVVYSYRNVTNEETVVVFPQQLDVIDGKDELQTGAISLPKPFTPHLADGFTVALRMRWDGPLRWCIDDADNTMTNMPYSYFFRAAGGGMSVTLGVNTPNRPPCDPSDAFAPLVQLFGNQKTFTNLYHIKTNEWIDAAFVVASDGKVTGYLHCPGQAEIVSQTVAPGIGTDAEGDATFQIGGATSGATASHTHTQYGQRSQYMCFRGAYQRVAVWQRSLSADEVREAFADPGVDIATFGRADGTADEFGGIAGETADVRAPARSWQGFPASFAATDAPTAISFALSETDVPVGFLSLDQWLRMKATPGSASGCWNIAVNGTALRPVSLEAGHRIRVRIPHSLLAAGTNILTLKYVGTGTAALDWLSLGGNWQLGHQDDGFTEFSGTISVSQRTDYHVGNGCISNVQRIMLINTGNNGQMGFHVKMPDDLVDRCRHVCILRASKFVTNYTVPVSLYLNGASEPVGTHEIEKGDYRDYRYEIPLGALKKGDNAFVFKMTGTDTETSTARYVGFDCFRLETIPTLGFMLMVR